MSEAGASTSTVPADLDGFLTTLAAAQARAFGASHVGARERLQVAHLADALVGTDERPGLSPEALRGALRAALAKTQAEAALFDRLYARATGAPEPPIGEIKLPFETPEPEPPPPPPPEPVTFLKWMRDHWRLLTAAAVVVLLVAAALVVFWPKGKAEIRNDAGGPAPSTAPGTTGPAGTTGTGTGGAPTTSNATATPTDAELQTLSVADKINAILDRAAPFGYRPSPRELASVATGLIATNKSELDFARLFAKAAGVSPDTPIDLFDEDKVNAIYANLHGPLPGSVRADTLAEAILARALERLEYLSLKSGVPVLYWREKGAWREQPFAGDGNDAEVDLASSKDGSRVLTSAPYRGALWDGRSQTLIRELPSEVSNIERAYFSPTGHRLIVDTKGSLVLIGADGKLLKEFNADSAGEVEFSPDGRIFLTTGNGKGDVHVWESDSAEAISLINPTLASRPFSSAHFSSDGQRIVTADAGGARVWSVAAGTQIGREITVPGGASDARFYANDTHLMVSPATELRGPLLWDLQTNQEIVWTLDLPSSGSVPAPSLSEDELKVYLAGVPDQESFVAYDSLVGGTGGHEITTASRTPGIPIVPGHAGFVEIDVRAGASRLHWASARSSNILVSEDFPVTNESQISFNVPSLRAAAERAAEFGRSRLAPARPLWPLWLAIGLPLLIAAIALAHPAAWRRAYLRRRQIENETLLRRLTAHLTAADPLKDERRAVARLDQRLRVPSHRMDVKATVLATARAGGMFTPVPDTDAGTPEYVALIEQRRSTDADAQRMIAFFNRLKSAGLSLVLYTYSGSPEALTPVRGGRAISIETLRQRHAGAFLFITGDAGRFYNHRTGAAAPWTRRIGQVMRGSQLRSFAPTWAGGAFLSREPLSRIGPAERAIERDVGLVVRGASAADLRDIGDYFHGRLATLAAAPLRPAALIPAYFSDEPDRLMQEAPASEIERAVLCAELDSWLGKDGLRWVRALAYYPMVQWDLARYLESVLIPKQTAEAREALEAKVTRLPWLEHGYMPEWVRETLIASADRAEERKVIGLIVDLMSRAEEGGDGEVSFSLAGAEGAPVEGAVDAIFIEAVARAKARPWDLPPPAEWLKNVPALARMPWARMRIALAGLALAAAAALIAPHTASNALLAEWLPLVVLALTAAATLLAPAALLRFVERRG